MIKLKDIHRIGIAGAGIMGASMAQIFARFGYNITIYDISEDSIKKGKELIHINQETAVAEGELSRERSTGVLERLEFTTNVEDLQNMDCVIEAIVEKMEIKHSFWDKVSNLVREEALLATNTSGLSITEIAKAVKNPERFCGMHWINPPHIVPLVEIISGDESSEEVVETIAALAEAVERKPVRVKKDIPGFLLNRFQFAILREAMHIVDSGAATKEDIDNVFKYGMGLRYACLGPFEIADFGGLDTFYNIARYLFEDLSNTTDISPVMAEPHGEGHFGVKSGKGFYDYSKGKDKKAIANRDKKYMEVSKVLYRK